MMLPADSLPSLTVPQRPNRKNPLSSDSLNQQIVVSGDSLLIVNTSDTTLVDSTTTAIPPPPNKWKLRLRHIFIGNDSSLVRTTYEQVKGLKFVQNVFPPKDPNGFPNPKAAALRSVLLPGWGQVYNRHAWKVPIVYAGLGGLIGWAIYNNRQYKVYKRAYLFRVDDNPTTVDDFPNVADSGLRNARDLFRRNRDLTFIITAGWYGLMVLEAFVDAHLQSFDVSEDLSLQASPTFLQRRITETKDSYYLGAKLTLNF